MKIILDVMSGDNAPLETLKGAVNAVKQSFAEGVEFVLVGNESVIKSTAQENKLDISCFEIRHAESILTMEDDPMAVMKEKADSSLSVALRMLAAGEGDVLVSAGNTGALFCGSTLIVKRVKGIQRAAIGAILPLAKPLMLMDSGASVQVTDDYLCQYAIMGSAYMKAIYGVDSPKVALVNNGAEEHKGTELQHAAFPKLRANGFINFIGNVEGNQLPHGYCDVAVCDGFVGNIVLKSIEGMGKLLSGELKGIFKSGLGGALAYLLVKKQMKNFKKKFDAKEHGGAPILGLSKTVIKAHGSSDAKAFMNAIRQAINCEKAKVCEIIAKCAEEYSAEKKRLKAEAAETAENG